MTTFTLHLARDARPGDPTALDESELVKDAFSWGAFFFTFLWFFYHRLWLAGIGVLVLVVAFGGLMAVLDVHPLAGTIAQLLLQVLIGLEANSLRRWTLTRRGRPMVDAVDGCRPGRGRGQGLRPLARGEARRPAPQPGALGRLVDSQAVASR